MADPKREITIEGYPRIPNMSDEFELFPHQAEALKKLDDPNNLGVIDASMGAGKTLITMSDMLNHMNNGNAKKPMWIMPDNTIPQQQEEVAMFTGGKVNTVALTSKTLNRVGVDGIMKAIMSAPPNTIFMSSYEFISKGKKWMKWRGKKGVPWPVSVNSDGFWDEKLEAKEIDNAIDAYKANGTFRSRRVIDLPRPEQDLALKIYRKNYVPEAQQPQNKRNFRKYYWKAHALLNAGIDMVTFDESHKAKSPTSDTRMACLVFTFKDFATDKPLVPLRRIASGTMTPNTPMDLYWQMKLVDPDFFGKKEDFIRTYAQVWDAWGNVEKWNQNALRDIRRRIQERGGNSIQRERWRYLLPDKEIKVHTVGLPKELQTTYDRIRDETLAEIKADPKLKKRWEQFTEDEDADVTLPDSILVKLGRLDQFVSAPETDPFTASLPPEERPNVKVKEIDKILDVHFADKENGKVIVFSSYKAVAASIIEDSRHKNIMVYYDGEKKGGLEKFKTNPNVKVLVSVDVSLREGHNLQMANRMIRVNIPWSPGAQEQAFGRAFRPPKRGTEGFKTVYIDMILMDETIEIPKFKRLIAKTVDSMVMNTDYEPEGDYEYPKMNLNTLRDDVDAATLGPFVDEVQAIETYEKEQGVRLKNVYGTDPYPFASGKEIKGSRPWAKANLMTWPKAKERGDKDPHYLDPLVPSRKEVAAWLSENKLSDYIPEGATGLPKPGISKDENGYETLTMTGDGMVYTFVKKGGTQVEVTYPNGNRVKLDDQLAGALQKILKAGGLK